VDHARTIAELCRPYLLSDTVLPPDLCAEPVGEGKAADKQNDTARPPLAHNPSKGFCHALTNIFPRLVRELQLANKHLSMLNQQQPPSSSAAAPS